MSKSLERSKSLQNQIQTYFDDHGYTIVTDISLVTNKKYSLDYICSCGKTKKKNFHDILTRECRTCNEAKHLIIPTDYSVCPSDNLNELWVAVQGGFISNLGNAINFEGKALKPDKSGRYFFTGKHHPSLELLIKAFGIEEQVFTLDRKNGRDKCCLDSLFTIRGDKKEERRFRYQELPLFKEAIKRNLERHMSKFRHTTLPEFPNYIIFEDGNIYNKMDRNGDNFIEFTRTYIISNEDDDAIASELNSFGVDSKGSQGYKDPVYMVDKIIMMAFSPIEGKKVYSDYKHIQVKHKDGNILNNHINNLTLD